METLFQGIAENWTVWFVTVVLIVAAIIDFFGHPMGPCGRTLGFHGQVTDKTVIQCVFSRNQAFCMCPGIVGKAAKSDL